ncbi:MAG TPA: OmpH family outer membrane protein [Pyrinomonadaceae bacterium]|nr:OmpH family outer membrane protein [Pyrinomonadaceae bacterium]
MFSKYLFPISALIVVAFATTICAQQPAATPVATPAARPAATPAPSAPAPQAAVPVPVSKMAVIYTDAFLDQKTGITKFNSVLAKLNGEFKQIKDELDGMQTRATTLEAEINNLRQNAATPVATLQTKIDQLEQLKKDAQRKGEDAQASYNRRRQELFLPLQEEIGKALEVFAKARGINVIIDGAQVPLLYAAESIDITRAFITEFNTKNPVAAATTATPPR